MFLANHLVMIKIPAMLNFLTMSFRRVACFLFLAIAWSNNCTAHTASGIYLNQGKNFIELLQITVKADGGFEGSLLTVQLKSDGLLSRNTTSVTGVIDGKSITLIMKPDLSFLQSTNLSGKFEAGRIGRKEILLFMSNGVVRYVESTINEYKNALSLMGQQSEVIKKEWKDQEIQSMRERKVAEANAAVDVLNKKLIGYIERRNSAEESELLQQFHAVHKEALVEARRMLKMQQKYPRGSYTASNISFEINQIKFRLEQYDYQWKAVPEQARSRLKELDLAISNSPCNNSDMILQNCAKQPDVIREYQKIKPFVERNFSNVEATIFTDHSTINAIVKQAEAYAK